MVTPEASQVGTRLDENHSPETNGRMPVCRKCGARTDTPSGHHHRPTERELARSDNWLVAEVRMSHIQQTRSLRAP
jgi:hypothetical protein